MELVLTLPILATILAGLAEFSFLFYARSSIVEANRVGARTASLMSVDQEQGELAAAGADVDDAPERGRVVITCRGVAGRRPFKRAGEVEERSPDRIHPELRAHVVVRRASAVEPGHSERSVVERGGWAHGLGAW